MWWPAGEFGGCCRYPCGHGGPSVPSFQRCYPRVRRCLFLVTDRFPAERPPNAVQPRAQARLRYWKEKQMRQNIIVASVIALVTVIAAVWGTIIVAHAPKQGSRVGSELDRCAADDEGGRGTFRGNIRRAFKLRHKHPVRFRISTTGHWRAHGLCWSTAPVSSYACSSLRVSFGRIRSTGEYKAAAHREDRLGRRHRNFHLDTEQRTSPLRRRVCCIWRRSHGIVSSVSSETPTAWLR